MPTVAFMAYPRALLSSITLPLEMLTAADQISRARYRTTSNLTLRVATRDGQSVGDSGPVTIQPNCRLDELGEVDLLYLPALWRNPIPVLNRHPEIIDLLQDKAASETLICAVGTSICFVAEAGLLDGKPATTHWRFIESFSRRYPKVQLKPRHLITQAGNLYCAGSVNSVADLTGYFIERFYGPRVARQVDAQFSPEIRRSYRQHGYFDGEMNLHHDEVIIDAQQWIHENFSKPFNFHALAKFMGMSQRTLNRRFKLATGISPGRYVQQLRLEHACELLRDSNLSIAEVASAVGYIDTSYFSTLFRQHMAQPPTEYRQSVRGKLFSVQT